MTPKPHNGQLVAGLILVALGAIFLLENWYGSLSVWHLIGRYWPVILIAVGAGKLYGYFTWREIPPPPNVPPKE